MRASYNPQFNAEIDDPSVFDRRADPRTALNGFDGSAAAAPAMVVNRTHRVVRHRARAMQARRSYVRSLLLPLALCSVLLALAAAAVWSGLYQYQAVEAAEAVQDVATAAVTDNNNHFLVLLLWFVPVSLAVLAAIWVRHTRSGGSETTR